MGDGKGHTLAKLGKHVEVATDMVDIIIRANMEYGTRVTIRGIGTKGQRLHIVVQPDSKDQPKVYVKLT